jgi:hypothetical protein
MMLLFSDIRVVVGGGQFYVVIRNCSSRRTTFVNSFPDLALSAFADHPISKDRKEKTATLKPRQTKPHLL